MADREPSLSILQIGGSLHDWGGIERYVAFLTKGLSALGHRAEVARPADAPLGQRTSGPNVLLRRKFDLDAFRAYRAAFRTAKYDVAHVHFSPDFVMAGFAARAEKVPLRVVTRHVAEPWSSGKARLYRALWPNAIAVSDAVKQVLSQAGYPPERLSTRYAGLEPLEPRQAPSAVRSGWGLDESAFIVGSFGRLTREKGTDVLVRALLNVPDVIGLIFGDGSEKTELEELAAPSQGRIRVMGRIEDVAEAMNAVDLVAVPSRWAEAFPFSTLEAMSLGKAVVASRVGGLPEQVTEGETGLLVEKEDHEQLANAIRSLAANRILVDELGRAARTRYLDRFTLGAFAKRVEDFYRECAKIS